MDALTGFLRAEARRAYDPARLHCLMLGADWARTLTGRDPAATWRDRVESEDVALAIVESSGGLEALMSRALEAIGWRETSAACRGDIGLIVVDAGAGPKDVCGVSTGSRWAVRATRGLWIGRADAVRVWRSPGRNGW